MAASACASLPRASTAISRAAMLIHRQHVHRRSRSRPRLSACRTPRCWLRPARWCDSRVAQRLQAHRAVASHAGQQHANRARRATAGGRSGRRRRPKAGTRSRAAPACSRAGRPTSTRGDRRCAAISTLPAVGLSPSAATRTGSAHCCPSHSAMPATMRASMCCTMTIAAGKSARQPAPAGRRARPDRRRTSRSRPTSQGDCEPLHASGLADQVDDRLQQVSSWKLPLVR